MWTLVSTRVLVPIVGYTGLMDTARRNQTLLVGAIRFALVCLVCCFNKFCSQETRRNLFAVGIPCVFKTGGEFVPTKHPIEIPLTRDGRWNLANMAVAAVASDGRMINNYEMKYNCKIWSAGPALRNVSLSSRGHVSCLEMSLRMIIGISSSKGYVSFLWYKAAWQWRRRRRRLPNLVFVSSEQQKRRSLAHWVNF